MRYQIGYENSPDLNKENVTINDVAYIFILGDKVGDYASKFTTGLLRAVTNWTGDDIGQELEAEDQ